MKSQSISPLNPAGRAELLNVNNERVQFSHACAWEMKMGVLMRRRDGKLLDRGHWKCLWGEEEGMTQGSRADLERVPWGSDKKEAGGESACSEGC